MYDFLLAARGGGEWSWWGLGGWWWFCGGWEGLWVKGGWIEIVEGGVTGLENDSAVDFCFVDRGCHLHIAARRFQQR